MRLTLISSIKKKYNAFQPLTFILIMSTVIKKKQNFRRRRAREPMVDGDVDSAEAVTHTRVAELQEDGTTIIKHVVESLDSTPTRSTAGEMQVDPPPFDNIDYDEMPDMSRPVTPRPRKSKVSIELYIVETFYDFP